MNPATTEDVVVDDDVNNVKEERAIDVMMRRNELMHTEKSIRNGREFVVKENDVFVATYPKSGTTWMQQIMHQIRCLREDRFAERAAMDFGEITEVVPWDILAEDCRVRLVVHKIYELNKVSIETDYECSNRTRNVGT